MKEYHNALKHILEVGETREDRTSTGTISTFGYQMRFNLSDGFPAITTKQLAWKGVVSELLWFLEGSDDERRLAEIRYNKPREELDDKTTIWTANANADYWRNNEFCRGKHQGHLGRVYGVQWRNWRAYDQNVDVGTDQVSSTDQIQTLIEGLRHNPTSRRHILTAWNAGEINQMALPPCHVLSQFYVSNDHRLSCQLYQRSADFGLGVPFNIASYALLTHMLAQITGLQVGEFVHTIGDAHIYLDHIDSIKEQLTREEYPSPTLQMPKFSTLDELLQTSVDQYKLLGYQFHPHIKMNMAV